MANSDNSNNSNDFKKTDQSISQSVDQSIKHSIEPSIKHSIKEKQDHLIAEFSELANWEDRYKLIIEQGRALGDYPEVYRREENKVRGCQSQVWLHAEVKDGKVKIYGDSDAMIVKGLVAILIRIYSDAEPQAILDLNPDFIAKLGFSNNLSPSRTNGLVSMIRQIKLFAQAFYLLEHSKK